MLEEAERGGQQLVLWDLSAVDWGPLATARGIARRPAAMRAGDIVLLIFLVGLLMRAWLFRELIGRAERFFLGIPKA